MDGDSHRFGACMAKGVYGQPTWSLGLAVERPFPVFAQGPQPDGFFRLVVFLVPVVPSASLGDADMGPSGGLVGDASEARRLHERFDQQGRDVIARGPVRNQLSAHDGQDVRGEVGDAYPGQDEEPGVVDDLGEIFLRSVGVQPMKRSRGASLRAAVENPSRANSWPWRSCTV